MKQLFQEMNEFFYNFGFVSKNPVPSYCRKGCRPRSDRPWRSRALPRRTAGGPGRGSRSSGSSVRPAHTDLNGGTRWPDDGRPLARSGDHLHGKAPVAVKTVKAKFNNKTGPSGFPCANDHERYAGCPLVVCIRLTESKSLSTFSDFKGKINVQIVHIVKMADNYIQYTFQE